VLFIPALSHILHLSSTLWGKIKPFAVPLAFLEPHALVLGVRIGKVIAHCLAKIVEENILKCCSVGTMG
jgi:hypothetical protein